MERFKTRVRTIFFRLLDPCDKSHSVDLQDGASSPSSGSRLARASKSEDFPMIHVPQQHNDHRFPLVLVISTLGTIISLASVWVTSLTIA